MATALQTTKKLKLLLFVFLTLFTFNSLTESTSAAFPATWWSDSTSKSQQFRDDTFSKFNSTFQDYVNDGHDYIIYQEGGSICSGIVATSLSTDLSFDDLPGNGISFYFTNPSFYYEAWSSGSPSSARQCGDQSIPSASHQTRSQNEWSSTFGLDFIVSARISSVSYTNGSTPTPSVSDINSNLKLSEPEPPFEPDPLWYNSAISIGSGGVAVPGSTNPNLSEFSPCRFPFNQTINPWRELSRLAEANTSPNNYEDALQRLNNVVSGSTVGGWVMATNEGDGMSKAVLFIYYGTANVVWQDPTPENPQGRVYISNTGITSRTQVTFNVNCSQFNNNGHFVSGVVVYNPGGNFGLSGSGGGESGGLWCWDTPCTYTRRSIFASGQINMNYPAGYTGVLVPDSYYEAEKIFAKTYTDFDVTTEGYQIKATYNGNQYDDPKCTFIQWRYVYIENWEDVYPTSRVQSATTLMGESLELIGEANGYYRIDANWRWATGYEEHFSDIGLNPDDMPTCRQAVIAGSGHVSELIELGRIPMNAGKAFPISGFANEHFGYTPNRECWISEESYHISGFYPPVSICVYHTEWEIQNCEAFGITELHLRFHCELNNLYIRINTFLYSLIIPRPGVINAEFNNTMSYVRDNTSVLTYSFVFVVDTLTVISNQPNQCTIYVDGIYGASTTFDLCYIKTKWSAFWDLGVAVFRISFFFTLAYALYRLYLRVFTTGSD